MTTSLSSRDPSCTLRSHIGSEALVHVEWLTHGDGSPKASPRDLGTQRRRDWLFPAKERSFEPPPHTPAFSPDSRHAQSSDKWPRRVNVRERQVSQCMLMTATALRLYEALKGDSGRGAVLRLRPSGRLGRRREVHRRTDATFSVRAHLQKTTYLHDYHKLRRSTCEPMWTSINRYKCVNRELKQVCHRYRDDPRGRGRR